MEMPPTIIKVPRRNQAFTPKGDTAAPDPTATPTGGRSTASEPVDQQRLSQMHALLQQQKEIQERQQRQQEQVKQQYLQHALPSSVSPMSTTYQAPPVCDVKMPEVGSLLHLLIPCLFSSCATSPPYLGPHLCVVRAPKTRAW